MKFRLASTLLGYATLQCVSAFSPLPALGQIWDKVNEEINSIQDSPLIDVSECAEIELNTDSCLIRSFLPIYLADHGGFDFGQNCAAPMVQEDNLRDSLVKANAACDVGGFGVSSDEIETTVDSIMALIADDNCWESLCDNNLVDEVTEAVNDVIGEIADGAMDYVADLVASGIGECTGADLNPESCVVNTSLEMIFFALNENGQNSTDYYQYHTGGGQNFRRILMESESKCELPPFESDYLAAIIQAAEIDCTERGEDILNDSADDILDALDTLFSGENCWKALCDEAETAGNEGLNMIKEVVIEDIGNCTGAVLNPESCVVNTALEMVFFALIEGDQNYTESEQNYYRRKLMEDGDYYYNYVGSESMCVPPPFESDYLKSIIQAAEVDCTERGEDISNDSADDILDALDNLFSGESCWKALCDEAEVIGMAVAVEMANEIKEVVVGSIGDCTGMDLNADSCIVNTALELIFFEYTQSDQNYTEYYNYTPGQNYYRRGLMEDDAVTTYYDNSVCEFPSNITYVIESAVEEAQYFCTQEEEDDSGVAADEILEALNKLFSDESCLKPLCEEVTLVIDGVIDEVQTTLENVSMQYISACSSTSIDANSCVQNKMMSKLFSGEGEAYYYERRKLQKASRHRHGEEIYDEFGNSDSRKLSSVPEDEVDDDLMECYMPQLDDDVITALLEDSKEECSASGFSPSDEEISDARETLENIVTATHCWENLCSDNPLATIASQTMESCMHITLPIAMTNPSDVHQHQQEYIGDERLACMLEYALSNQLDRDFVFEPIDQCVPPGFHVAKDICITTMAPAAYEYCSSLISEPSMAPSSTSQNNNSNRALMMSYSYSYSYGYYEDDDDFAARWQGDDQTLGDDNYSYSMSYEYNDDDDFVPKEFGDDYYSASYEYGDDYYSTSYEYGDDYYSRSYEYGDDGYGDDNYSMSYGYDDDQMSNDDDDVNLGIVEDFCSILDRITSSEGQQCLAPLCHLADEFGGPASLWIRNTFFPPMPYYPPNSDTGSVEVKFEASIQLDLGNIGVNEIPTSGTEFDNMVKVLENVLSQYVPDNASVRIISVGGVPVNVRRLNQGLEVEFEVIVRTSCESASCGESAQKATAMYDDVKSDLSTAVSSGSLTSSIKEEATKEGVQVLKSVEVETDSFAAEEMTVVVVQPVLVGGDDDSVDDDDDESAANDDASSNDDDDGGNDDNADDDDDDDDDGSSAVNILYDPHLISISIGIAIVALF